MVNSIVVDNWDLCTGGHVNGGTSGPDCIQTAGDGKVLDVLGGAHYSGSIRATADAFSDVPVGATIYKITMSWAAHYNSGGTWNLTAQYHYGVLTGTLAAVYTGTGTPPSSYTWDGLNIVVGAAADLKADWTLTNTLNTAADIDRLALTLFYNRAPTAPTLTSPANNAVRQSTVPVFQGTHNDPDGDSMSGVQIEVRRVSDDNVMWLSSVLDDPGTTFSQAYAGSALQQDVQYKWRARTTDNNPNPLQGAWSAFRNFTVHTNLAPTATQSSPSAGAQVGTLTPSLVFAYTDPENDTFQSYQVEVQRVSDSVYMWQPAQTDTTSAQQTARSATVAYAGTALSTNIQYQWRARVKDIFGLWSNWTGWRTFTPKLVPNAPTGIAPSGLQNTLTPTISGTYSQGTGGTEVGFQYEIQQGGTTIYQSGDVTGALATGQAYGSANSGDTPSSPPALAWGTSYNVRVRSKDNAAAYSDWTDWQAFSTNAAPTTPTNLSPAGGAITGDTTPDLSWQHNDPDGDAQTAVEINLYDLTSSAYVTGYNPKALTQSTQVHTVTGTTLTNTHQYQWQVRTKGLAGPGFSPWSALAIFNVANAPSVSVTDPVADDVEASPSVPVAWSFTGGSGTQGTYRVKVFAADGTTLVHDSGIVSGTATSYTIPSGVLHTANTYYVQVLVVDTLSQNGQSTPIRFTTDWTPPATITGVDVQSSGSQVVT